MLTNHERLVQRIRSLLDSELWSQKRIAEGVGYSAAAINQWMQGKYKGKIDAVNFAVEDFLIRLDGDPVDPEDAVVFELFFGFRFFVVRVDNRPWTPIEAICAALGIAPHTQLRRLRQHARLELLPFDRRSWTLLPLEELQWFLRTLRPRSETACENRDRIRGNGVLFWALAREWLTQEGKINPAAAMNKRDLRRTVRDNRQKAPDHRPPLKTSRFDSGDAAEMQRLHSEGKKYTEIAKLYGTGKSTVWEIINGTYAPLTERDPNNRAAQCQEARGEPTRTDEN